MINCDIEIRGGGYVAEISSFLGATCFRLTNKQYGADVLRSPENAESLAQNVFLYGNPLLFPPNRIRGGEFVFNGKKYVFPINEPQTGCHLHGALYSEPFEVVRLSKNGVTLVYRANNGEYIGFPHAFTFVRTYTLDENGLTETDEIQNDSDGKMPFMLAFHTTYNLPFVLGGSKRDVSLRMPVVLERVRDRLFLPTGETRFGEREEKMKRGEFIFDDGADTAFYETENGCVCLTDKKTGVRLCIECSSEFKYKMFYRSANANFVAIEPQTSAIDCFHLDGSAEENGLIVVEPHSSLRLTVRTYLEK